MTPIGPPKRAPKEVPPEPALYLDNAAEYLTELVKEYGLDLRPYDQHRPDQKVWLHGLYGTMRDRDFCIQVVTDAEMAPAFAGLLRCHLRLYPRDGSSKWLLYQSRRVKGMAELMLAAAELTEAAHLACVWRMPHPTDPDPKT